jgi:hypothetical protein
MGDYSFGKDNKILLLHGLNHTLWLKRLTSSLAKAPPPVQRKIACIKQLKSLNFEKRHIRQNA